MESAEKMTVQQQVSEIPEFFISTLHNFQGVPEDFKPWNSGLSPSALYNCSLSCRKKSKIKTPEVKWMSIKRWVSTTPEGIILPPGVFLSIKRHEDYVPLPQPHFVKNEYTLLMFPYGNVWSQQAPGVPINEEWIWSKSSDGKLIMDSLIRRDAAFPVAGYFKSCYEFMKHNPDLIGIHLKRKRKESRDST